MAPVPEQLSGPVTLPSRRPPGPDIDGTRLLAAHFTTRETLAALPRRLVVGVVSHAVVEVGQVQFAD
jgi:hypothetical protein